MYQTFDHLISQNENLFVYTNAVTSDTPTQTWQVWDKPKNAKAVWMTGLGGGGGGAGGGASLNLTAGGCGGGGGSGGVQHSFFMADLLPDRLYIRIGLGGIFGTGQVQGGAASTGGTPGSATYVVSDDRAVTAAFLFLLANGGGAGNAGSGASNGSLGSGGAAGAITTATLSPLGMPFFLAGQDAAFVGFDLAFNNLIGTGGGSGAAVSALNATAAGSAILNGGLTPTIPGGLAGGGNGIDGFLFIGDPRYPFVTTGGSGGGSNTGAASVGGSGGNAAYGSGGGGGGGVNGAGSTAGNGGNGGGGFLLIQVF